MGQAAQDPKAAKAAQISQIQQQPDPTQMAQMPMGLPGQMQDFVPTAMQESSQGREGLATEAQRIQNNISRQQQLEDYVRQMSGHLAYQPHMAPMTGQGFGRDLLNVFGNIGKVGLTGLAATAPGQAIQSVAYSQPRSYVADAINEIKQRQVQNAAEGELARTYGGEATHALYPAARYGGEQLQTNTRRDIAQMNDTTRRIIDQHHTQLAQQMLALKDKLGTGKLNEEAKRTVVMQAKNMIDADHNNAIREIAASVTDERDRAAQIDAANKQYEDHKKYWLQDYLGIGPSVPNIPPRTQPLPGQGQNAQPNRTKSNKRGNRPPGW